MALTLLLLLLLLLIWRCASTAALGGSIWYGEARRKEKANEKLARSKEVRDKEFDKSMKLAEAATAAETTG